MKPAFALVSVLTLTAPALAAQARAIPLPDTLGASFDVADSATATSAAGDYDFLLGTWQFRFQGRNQNGSFAQPFTGHWVVTKKETGGKGTLIEDHWRPDDPGSTWEAGTWTWRAFNPRRKIWEMEGINIANGAWQPGTMWSAGADRVLIEWYGRMLVRFRYFAIQPNHFLWRADATFDRGKTWISDFWTMEATRVAR